MLLQRVSVLYNSGVELLDDVEFASIPFLCVACAGAVLCVTLLDRLKGDQISTAHSTMEEWQLRPQLIVSRYIKKQLGIAWFCHFLWCSSCVGDGLPWMLPLLAWFSTAAVSGLACLISPATAVCPLPVSVVCLPLCLGCIYLSWCVCSVDGVAQGWRVGHFFAPGFFIDIQFCYCNYK